MPSPTGSTAIANTIGIVEVTCIAAAAALPVVTMTFILSRTNSAVISPKRSSRPSAQRYSILTVRFSIQPSSFSRCTKAVVHGVQTEGVPAPRKPMIGIVDACWARTMSGQVAAAPAAKVITSRRRNIAPEVQDITSGYYKRQTGGTRSYSITSTAINRKSRVRVRPNAFAAFRLERSGGPGRLDWRRKRHKPHLAHSFCRSTRGPVHRGDAGRDSRCCNAGFRPAPPMIVLRSIRIDFFFG